MPPMIQRLILTAYSGTLFQGLPYCWTSWLPQLRLGGAFVQGVRPASQHGSRDLPQLREAGPHEPGMPGAKGL